MRFFIAFLYLMICYSSFAQCNTHIITDNSFTICKGNSIQINTNNQLKNFQWFPAKFINDVNTVSPIISPDTTITYFVQAVDANGCINKDSIIVQVIDCSLPGQYINISNIDFGSGKMNPSIISYDSIIPVKFVNLSGDPPSAFTTDGYTVVNKIPQSLNNDWYTGALNHTPNQGDSGYMAIFHNAPSDGILFDKVYQENNVNTIFATDHQGQFSFSYAYPFNKPLNSYCNGNNFPAPPSLQVKITLGSNFLGKFRRMKDYPCGNGPNYPTGCVDSDSLLLYPDGISSNSNGIMNWTIFNSSALLPYDIQGYSGNTMFRIQIFNLTPPSQCGNDIVLDDIRFNHYITYKSFSFRLPYDTIQSCSKNSINLAPTDFSYAPADQIFIWYRSIDKGRTWQYIINTNSDTKQLNYIPQQNEEWIRLDAWDNGVSPLPSQRFQSNYVVLLSNYVFNANAGNDTALCKGASLQLNATGGTYNLWSPPDYLSNTNTLNPLVTPATSMQYILQTSNDPNFAANCTSYDTINIRVDEKPIVVAGNNQTINQGDSTKMNGVVVGNDVLLHWEPRQFFSDNTKLNAVCKPDTTRTFYLYADSKYGCGTGLDSMKIFVTPASVVIPPTTTPVASNAVIPNAFSPNGDGINDTWEIPLLKTYPNCSVEVYSRYGQLVFKSIGYSKNWDGTFNNQALPIGTYYYIIKTSPSANPLSGSVLVIR